MKKSLIRFQSLQAGSRELAAKTGVGGLFRANDHQRSDSDVRRPSLCHARICEHLDAGDCQAKRNHPGAIYRHFESKAQLLMEVVRYALQTLPTSVQVLEPAELDAVRSARNLLPATPLQSTNSFGSSRSKFMRQPAARTTRKPSWPKLTRNPRGSSPAVFQPLKKAERSTRTSIPISPPYFSR